MKTKLELSLPLECTLETDHTITPEEMNKLLEVIDGIATVEILDEQYFEIAEKHGLRQVSVNGITYQYMLLEQANKLVEVKDISDILNTLKDNNFGVKQGLISYFDEPIAKLNILGKWVQLKKEINELNIPLIYSFPDTFKVFQSNYSISIKKLKELVSIGQLEINHELWEE